MDEKIHRPKQTIQKLRDTEIKIGSSNIRVG